MSAIVAAAHVALLRFAATRRFDQYSNKLAPRKLHTLS